MTCSKTECSHRSIRGVNRNRRLNSCCWCSCSVCFPNNCFTIFHDCQCTAGKSLLLLLCKDLELGERRAFVDLLLTILFVAMGVVVAEIEDNGNDLVVRGGFIEIAERERVIVVVVVGGSDIGGNDAAVCD